MTDIVDYSINTIQCSIYDTVDTTRLSTINALPQEKKKDKEANYLDIITLISNITTPNEIDYQLIADFFLTYRSFISPQSLLKLLLLRIDWCLTCVNDEAHEHKQNIGKLTLVRTFVVMRHWLVNYFAEDFVSSEGLRSLFVHEINMLIHHELFVQRVVGSLKKTWTESCNKTWDESVTAADFYEFDIKIGPQSQRNKRLSLLALSQQNDPKMRNSMMLSTYDKNMVHKLPIPLPSLSQKRKPNLFLNPKNSNLRLSMLAQTSPTSAYTTIPSFTSSSRSPTSPMSPRSPSDPLYIPLLSVLDPKARNILRDESRFPKNSTVSKVLPPTPVKKMDIVVPLPPSTKPQPRGLRPLIEHWIRTFHSHGNNKAKLQTTPYVDKFMASVVSVAKPTSEELERLALGKFDILSARSIDELEHLVRFHNVILSRHASISSNVRNSFNFTIPGSRENVKAISNIDNMNLCETISNISKSVVSLQQHMESETRSCKSYVSYDSVYSTRNGANQKYAEQTEDAALKKKSRKENLREFNFESHGPEEQDLSRDGDDEKFEFESGNEHDDKSTLETFPSSILSESTPIHHDSTSVSEGPEQHADDDGVVDKKDFLPATKKTETDAVDIETGVIEVAELITAESIPGNLDSYLANPDTAFEKSVAVAEPQPQFLQTEVQAGATDTNSIDEEASPLGSESVEGERLATNVESAETMSTLVPSAVIDEAGADVMGEEHQQDTDAHDVIPIEEVTQQENTPIPPPHQENIPVSESVKSLVYYDLHDGSSILSPVESTHSINSEASDYDEIESFVSTYEELDVEDLEIPEIENSANQSDIMTGDNEPSTPTHEEGLISSTPQISPIKAIEENHNFQKMTSHSSIVAAPPVPPKNDTALDLNKVPSFTRISNGSIASSRQDNRVSYLSKRSIKSHKTSASENSIFSGQKTSNLINVCVQNGVEDDGNETEIAKSTGMSTPRTRHVSDDFSLQSDDFQIPYPGVDSDAIAELAAISDESYQDDPINAALQKLEGHYRKRTAERERALQAESSPSSVNTDELKSQVADLAIQTPIRKRDSVMIDQRRKTKLFSLTPVQQKDVKYDESSSKILLELLLSHKINNEILRVSNSEHHVSFILNFDSKTLAEQLTLIEKDALLEIDWKELVELTWESEKLVPINSWLELLVQNQDVQGVDLCVSRFNLTVNWIISEILLTKDNQLRKLTIQRFIHVAQHCKALQNYSTLMQILLALGSDKVMKLKETWRVVEPGDILIYKNLESISSPLRNFMNLRMELNKIKPSRGCVPFLGLYLSDLIFNKEKRSVQGEQINFGKFKTTSKIARSLIQCIQWSTLYKIEANDEVLSKCLYIKALSEEEMNECLQQVL